MKKHKLISWNVNGLRSVSTKGFLPWLKEQSADAVCLQEIKVFSGQLEPGLRSPAGYFSYFNSAKKPGYSGVATYTKKEPLKVLEGFGSLGIKEPEGDREGRLLTLEFPEYYLVNAYFPNSQRDHARLPFKLRFCARYFDFVQKLRKVGKPLYLCGDFNIAHQEIDLKNPKTNKDNAGFLPEERAWMTEFIGQGWLDGFRNFTADPGHYTWWSYRPGVREKNVGWRIDYFMTQKETLETLRSVIHQHHIMGSDHCPVELVCSL